MQTKVEFIEKYKVKMESVQMEDNPNFDAGHKMTHWSCEIRCGTRRVTIPFSQGLAHEGAEPELDSVLDCLVSDAQGAVDQSFEEWASDYGYDTDSRKAEKIYKACCATATKLKRLFKDPEVYQEFLATEPL